LKKENKIVKGIAVDLIVKIILAIIVIAVGYLIFAWIINNFPTILDWICNVPVIEGLDYCKGWKETRAIQQNHLYPGEEDAIIKDKGYIVRKGAFIDFDCRNGDSLPQLQTVSLSCPDTYGSQNPLNPFENEVCHVFVKTEKENYLFVLQPIPLCFEDYKPLYLCPTLCDEKDNAGIKFKIRKYEVPDITKRVENFVKEITSEVMHEGDKFEWQEEGIILTLTKLEIKTSETPTGVFGEYEFDWMFEFKGEKPQPQIGCCQFSPSPDVIKCDMVTKEECEMVYQGSWHPNEICQAMGMGQIQVCVPTE